jgi:PPK2 family polyphosphate:nucleotide phosphotransferase
MPDKPDPARLTANFDIDHFRVKPGDKVDLGDIDTRATPFWDRGETEEEQDARKATAKEFLLELNDRMEELQDLLWAEGTNRVLVVLQAMDAAGKDGTIRHVFDGVNPSGVRVAAFKKPSSKELAHDYLWRVHAQVPGDGELVIFNRSHYEDVLVVRVFDLAPEDRWKKRFDHIVNFEEMLVDEGTTIVKIFLHISKEEQKERFQARLDEPDKNWKFEPGDLAARERWDDYMQAFEDVLERTSTDDSPWYIIPADRKWYRNLAISEILIQTLERLEMRHPDPAEGLDEIVIPD